MLQAASIRGQQCLPLPGRGNLTEWDEGPCLGLQSCLRMESDLKGCALYHALPSKWTHRYLHVLSLSPCDWTIVNVYWQVLGQGCVACFFVCLCAAWVTPFISKYKSYHDFTDTFSSLYLMTTSWHLMCTVIFTRWNVLGGEMNSSLEQCSMANVQYSIGLYEGLLLDIWTWTWLLSLFWVVTFSLLAISDWWYDAYISKKNASCQQLMGQQESWVHYWGIWCSKWYNEQTGELTESHMWIWYFSPLWECSA